MTKQRLALSLCTMISGALMIFAQPARACRDCPFPMKIGQHQWLLPDGDVVLTIDEEKLSDTEVIMTVTLQDSSSGRMIATGLAYRQRSQHSVSVQLHDRSGRKMRGTITWSDEEHNKLQAEFVDLETICAQAGAGLPLLHVHGL